MACKGGLSALLALSAIENAFTVLHREHLILSRA